MCKEQTNFGGEQPESAVPVKCQNSRLTSHPSPELSVSQHIQKHRKPASGIKPFQPRSAFGGLPCSS